MPPVHANASPSDAALTALVRAARRTPVEALPARGQRLGATVGIPLTPEAAAVISAKTGRAVRDTNGNQTTRLLTLKRSVRSASSKPSSATRTTRDYAYSCTITVYGWLWPDGYWAYDHSDMSCMEYYFPDVSDGGGGGGDVTCDTGAIYVAVGDDAAKLAADVIAKLAGAGGGGPNDAQRQADIAKSDSIPVAESHFFDHASQILANPTLDATQTGLMRGIARLMVASGAREAGYVGSNGVSQMFVTPTNIWVQNFPGMFSGSLPAYFVTFQNLSTGKLTTLITTSSKNLPRIIQSFLNKQVGYDANDPDGAGDAATLSAADDDSAFTDKPPICTG